MLSRISRHCSTRNIILSECRIAVLKNPGCTLMNVCLRLQPSGDSTRRPINSGMVLYIIVTNLFLFMTLIKVSEALLLSTSVPFLSFLFSFPYCIQDSFYPTSSNNGENDPYKEEKLPLDHCRNY